MKTTMTAGGSAAWVHGIAPDGENREKDDFYETPPEATEALLGAESFNGPIWEPACGRGAISRVLEASGYTVVSTDLVDRGYGEPRVDFLMEPRSLAPNVVTNPPYKLAVPFIRKALSLTSGKTAMLCRLAFLESAERKALFEETPIARVLVFSSRVAINRNGEEWGKNGGAGGMIAFAWYVWDHAHEGPPTLGWL